MCFMRFVLRTANLNEVDQIKQEVLDDISNENIKAKDLKAKLLVDILKWKEDIRPNFQQEAQLNITIYREFLQKYEKANKSEFLFLIDMICIP